MKTVNFYSRIKAIIMLVRLRNAVITFIGVVVGAILYTQAIPLEHVFIAGLSAAMVLGGGNIINDYFDIESDKTNKPWRPLPAGNISMSDTLMLAITFFIIGIWLSKNVNQYCLALATINSAILALYGRYSKRLLLVSNLSISYLVASVFIFGALATIEDGEQITAGNTWHLTVVVACSFLMTLSREIVKDIEDIEGDNKVYATSLPIRIGEKKSSFIAAAIGLTAVAISLTPIFYPTTAFNNLVYTMFIIVADLVFLVSFTMHPALGQRIMVAGMLLSLTAFLAATLVPA